MWPLTLLLVFPKKNSFISVPFPSYKKLMNLLQIFLLLVNFFLQDSLQKNSLINHIQNKNILYLRLLELG